MPRPKKKAKNTVWLELPDYHVVALKRRLAEHVEQLERAIHQGILAYSDLARRDFFDVEVQNEWFYIHVHADAHAVYLVAHSSRRFISLPGENDSDNEPERQNDGMHEAQSTAFKLDREVPFEARGSPAHGLDLLSVILSRALHDEANFRYLVPDEQERRLVLPWFFRTLAIRASQVCGEIYTTETIDGAALWIGPDCEHTFSRVLRTGILTAPFRLGWTSLRRCWRLNTRLEEIHKRLIREALIDPVLSQADCDGLSCYSETFNPANLAFYKNRGFRIEGAGRIAREGPNFWVLVRAPR
jgi:hypothetical protein